MGSFAGTRSPETAVMPISAFRREHFSLMKTPHATSTQLESWYLGLLSFRFRLRKPGFRLTIPHVIDTIIYSIKVYDHPMDRYKHHPE